MDIKRLFLILFCVFVTILIVAVDTPQPTKKSEESVVGKKTACINGINSLNAAQTQKKMLDQQLTLSKASGRAEEVAIISAQVKELKTIIAVFEELIADPSLECSKYKE